MLIVASFDFITREHENEGAGIFASEVCNPAGVLNWNDLRYLIAAQRAGSLAGAAKHLKVDQATVSRRLAALEEALGTRLFDRTSDGLVLTPAGERAIAELQGLEERIAAVETKVAGGDERIEGTVRIATSENLALGFLLKDLVAVCRTHSDLALEIVTGTGAVNLLVYPRSRSRRTRSRRRRSRRRVHDGARAVLARREALIGFGCMRCTDAAPIEAALEAGITLFDTARAYEGNEALLAKALAGRPARIVTKGGMGRGWVPDGRARSIEADFEASMTALGRIDLYLLHAPDPAVPFATSVRALARLKIPIGLSNVNRTQLDAALAIAPIAAVEVALGARHDEPLRNGLVRRCIDRGIEVLAHSPFGGPKHAPKLAKDKGSRRSQKNTERTRTRSFSRRSPIWIRESFRFPVRRAPTAFARGKSRRSTTTIAPCSRSGSDGARCSSRLRERTWSRRRRSCSSFRTFRDLEPPELDEGFDSLERIPFVRRPIGTNAARFVAIEALAIDPSLEEGACVFGWQTKAPHACLHLGGPPRCWCRPPLPGLLLRFAFENDVDLSKSTLHGTKPIHATMARALGLTFVPVPRWQKWSPARKSADPGKTSCNGA